VKYSVLWIRKITTYKRDIKKILKGTNIEERESTHNTFEIPTLNIQY
jgi:hypothetical protein